MTNTRTIDRLRLQTGEREREREGERERGRQGDRECMCLWKRVESEMKER